MYYVIEAVHTDNRNLPIRVSRRNHDHHYFAITEEPVETHTNPDWTCTVIAEETTVEEAEKHIEGVAAGNTYGCVTIVSPCPALKNPAATFEILPELRDTDVADLMTCTIETDVSACMRDREIENWACDEAATWPERYGIELIPDELSEFIAGAKKFRSSL